MGPERIGAYLARQRQLRGIALEDLASQTRIPLRSLQRLESGAFDHEPDGFARGFVRTVAIALGLPPDETIARMLPEVLGDDGAGAGGLVGPARAVAGAALLGALAASLWLWLGRDAGPAVAPVFQAREDGLVVRRDAVRALAAEHGLLREGASAPLLTPEPPRGEESAAADGGAAAAAGAPTAPGARDGS
jgi:hypothetical protein